MSWYCQEAEKLGLTLVMESLRAAETNLVNSLPQLVRYLRELGAKNIRPMIDTCAMGVAGENPEQWFQVMGNENIIHMHFVDGLPYGHLIWGDGRHDLASWLKILQNHHYKGLLSQEITALDYCYEPADADRRNYQMFVPYMS